MHNERGRLFGLLYSFISLHFSNKMPIFVIDKHIAEQWLSWPRSLDTRIGYMLYSF